MTEKYLSVAQMREADRRCIEDIGMPGALLMNNAGTAVFREIDSAPIGIVCGKGNNGGDGFVVARLALLAGLDVRVLVTAAPSEIQGDAQTFLSVYERLGGTLEVVRTEDEAQAALASFSDCETIIDALLGTGTKGEVRGVARYIIEHWPAIRTIAVDLPSGMDGDTGKPCGVCVTAETTVTFQFPKLGFRDPAAHAYLGRVIVADIGIPPQCAQFDATPPANRR